MCEEVHHCIFDNRVWEGVSADIAPLRIPLQELYVRNEYSMAVAAGEEVVSKGHVYYRATFDAVFVTHIEPYVVLDVKFLEAFMFLEGKVKQIVECESILVMCIDEEVGVNNACRRILDDCVWSGVVQAHPV